MLTDCFVGSNTGARMKKNKTNKGVMVQKQARKGEDEAKIMRSSCVEQAREQLTD